MTDKKWLVVAVFDEQRAGDGQHIAVQTFLTRLEADDMYRASCKSGAKAYLSKIEDTN